MKICFVAGEFFSFGRYGGFGTMTRNLALVLKENGMTVTAVIPRKTKQPDHAVIDGINIYSYPPSSRKELARLLKEADADIYHSMEPNWGTYVARKTMPDRKHIVTGIDPRNSYDWMVEFLHYPIKRKLMFPLIWGFESNPLIMRAVRKADLVGCQTKFIIPKTRKMYKLDYDPLYLPNPIQIPDKEMVKSEKPTVFFLARWDHRKRPEMFLQLAQKFPEVEFIMMGKSRYPKYDEHLRNKYKHLPNLNMIGFVDQYKDPRFGEILERSWILINTASREGLPASFQESVAHKCAILAHVNPDDYASEFGFWAENDNFEEGLRFLLKDDNWRKQGQKGYDYLMATNTAERVFKVHEETYNKVLSVK